MGIEKKEEIEMVNDAITRTNVKGIYRKPTTFTPNGSKKIMSIQDKDNIPQNQNLKNPFSQTSPIKYERSTKEDQKYSQLEPYDIHWINRKKDI